MAREKKLNLIVEKEEEEEVIVVKEEEKDYLKELIEERKKNDKLATLVATYKTALNEQRAECEERKKKYTELWNAFLNLKGMK